ncbi:MAG TPA: asparagine synthase (glutamine-hydrolyzing) [Phycisphaerae bacterium]|nr:asparagine synthase (glutamine-hydrolyzing) [Phycisphaerae bacterium]
MCGISGIIDYSGAVIDKSVLERACATMRHRGPDDFGTWQSADDAMSIGLAAVRLAVVDPTPQGHQPFIYQNRWVLVFNGEVYNHRTLRGELQREGCRFETQTDTEVVAAACATWGVEGLRRFNGMWGLCFFDREGGRGFLARDRFGIKPIVYANDGSRTYFASESQTLRGLGDWDRGVDTQSLLHYVRFGFTAPEASIYRSARRLSPGGYLEFDRQGVRAPQRYYAPVAEAKRGTSVDYGDACANVRRGIFQSVARRRHADVPLGAFLSGGIDSSIIATHLAECTPGKIATFSVGYAGQRAYDESRYARQMANHIGSDHHELSVTADDVIALIPQLLDHLGEPFFDSSLIPTAMVSQLARKHVTVCLSGDGADELFGGYWRYLGHDSLHMYRRIPAMIRRRVIEPLLALGPRSKRSVVGRRLGQMRKLLWASTASMQARHLAWSQILSRDTMGIIDAKSVTDLTLKHAYQQIEALAGGFADGDLNQILAFDLQYSLPADMLHKVDIASMRHSLEVRTPFLDHELVEYVLGLPARFKMSRGLRKRLLVDAYRGVIPDAILDRGKMGFEVPVGEFFRRGLREMFLDTVTRERLDGFGVFDSGAVLKLYDDHCAFRGEYTDILFAILSLCWWQMRGGTVC